MNQEAHKKPSLVDEIIDGIGELELAKLCELHQSSIQAWRQNGIPEKKNFWAIVIENSVPRLTAAEILLANYQIRNQLS